MLLKRYDIRTCELRGDQVCIYNIIFAIFIFYVGKMIAKMVKRIIVPNASPGNGNIVNYSSQTARRVDLTDIVKKDERILNEPDYQIVVGELVDNSVNFFVRVWVKSEDYWDVFFAANESVKLRLDEAGIGIPYPQHDVHLYEHKAA